MKSKERQKLSEETKETWWQIAVWESGWILEQKKGIRGETGEIQVRYVVVLNSDVSVLISYLWRMSHSQVKG